MELQNPSLFGYCIKCLIVTLLFSLYLKSPTTKVNALSNETDRLALLSFKESISNDPHGVLKSWNDSVHFCSWYGITCNTKHHRVTTLNLNSSKLRGTLTPYIGNLTFLKFINLRNNSFFGEIPEQVGHLIRLQHLNLSDNSFVSNVPMNLSYCSQLRIINLKSNGLVGNIPSGLGSLVKLVLLYLDLNNLTGTIPPSLGNITSLRQFSIKYNNLVGSVPQELGQLKNLSYLGLGPNKFSGIVPHSLFNMSSMTTFVLTDNQLYGTLPSSIGFTLPNIQSFAIAGNSFSGLIPESFSNASLLQLLDIQENNFYGHVPTSFGALQNLQILGLSRNGLGNNSDHDLDFITSLTNCSNLETLDLSFNKHGGVLPNSVANLSTKLSKLYLGVNHISGKIPETLGNFINLYVLGMQYNQFTGEIPTSFGKLYKMQVLDLLGNRISGSIPFNIGNLTRLSELYLSDNQLEGNIPTSIANCENLQLMDMSQNKLSGAIPKEVIGLSTLSLALNLSLNNLSGSLPMEVGKLRSIKALDVSGNNLDGEIPETIGDCQNIEVLFLQQNIFVGNLPQTLVSLSGLQCLDISQNNLSGQIPKDLQKLHFLTYLNLSFNNFEGEVPYEGVFRNASIVSVVGNPKLCGSIPELLLPSCSIKLEKHGKKGGKRLTIIITLVVASFLLFMSFVVIVRQWLKKSKKKVPYATSDLDSLPKVSYRKLQQITDGFSPSKLIGKGSFGSVYQATLDHNDIVAIKVLNLLQKGASKSFIAECNALRNIRHRNLVKVLTCCSSMDFSGNEFKAIVFEYLSNGSLENWLHPVVHNADQSRCLNLVQRLNIIIDVASAMNYLHDHCEPPIVHCDLKPSNVLLDNDMVAHVSDFGLARLITKTDCSHNQSSTVGIKGTIGYAAPEYAMGCEPSKKGDVYSFGILVLEILTEKTPTDEMFKDGLNLRKYVEMEFPERLVQIVDPALLTKEVQEMVLTQENENHSDIAIEETNESANSTKIDVNAKKCLLSMLKIGLACSVEIQNDRMIMEDVNRELRHSRDAFVNSVGILSES